MQSQLTGGDPALRIAEHQVTADGVITPRASAGGPAPVYTLTPADFEVRETVLWSIQLREAL